MQVDVIHLSLGVEGFRVIACDERDGAIEVAIETLVPLACCPGCGHAEIVAKERKPLWVRDIPLRPGKQTWLIWWKRRFACIRCKSTCTETHDEIPPRATHTRHFDDYLSARATASTRPRASAASTWRPPGRLTHRRISVRWPDPYLAAKNLFLSD
jgi:transposase